MSPIAVLAPMVDDVQVATDFVVRFAADREEATLQRLDRVLRTGERQRSAGAQDPQAAAAGYYLESRLRREGLEVVLEHRTDPASLRRLAAAAPSALCLSTSMIIDAGRLQSLVRRIRDAMPDVFLIAGGTLLWKSFLALEAEVPPQPGAPLFVFEAGRTPPEIDVAVVSPHGIESLLRVLAALEKGRRAELEQIPNLALRKDGGFAFTARVEERVDFDQDFTHWDFVAALPARVPLRTSIGCPFRCAFCDFWQLCPTRALRSAESLKRELETVQRAGSVGHKARLLHLTDENVFASRRRIGEICDALEASQINLPWISFMRASAAVEEALPRLRRAGLVAAMVGVESGDQAQLERLEKHQDAKQVARCLQVLDAQHIATLLTLIVGFPGETDESIARTADYLNALELANASYQLYPFALMPLSPISQPERRRQWRLEGMGGTWSHATADSARADAWCRELFERIRQLPYHYADESAFWNMQFPPPVRRELFERRRELTLHLMNRAPAAQVEETVSDLARLLRVPSVQPSRVAELAAQLTVA